jgi:hypothetical protein
MDDVKKYIDKDFWESKHKAKKKFWLTGSSLLNIMNFHKLNEVDIKDKKILEIGVGLGNLSKELINYTDKLICCDISEKALSSVSDKVTKKYLTTDLNKIEPVDLAICHLVFQHCIDKEVERIINDVVLSDEGTFTFQFAYIRDNEQPNQKVTDLIKLGSHHFRGLKQIEKMVDRSGKEIIWVSEPYNFHNPENFSWLIVKIKNKNKIK